MCHVKNFAEMEPLFNASDRMYTFSYFSVINLLDKRAQSLRQKISEENIKKYEIFEGFVSYRQSIEYDGLNLIIVKLKNSNLNFYIFDETKFFRKYVSLVYNDTEPIKVVVYDSREGDIVVVRRVTAVLRIVGIETKFILSDGSFMSLVAQENQIIIPVTQTYTSLISDSPTKEKLQSLICNLVCRNCQGFAPLIDRCLTCEASYCKKCRHLLKKDKDFKGHTFIQEI